MWLTGRFAPDFKTSADFRRDNGPAIRATCRQFVLLCRKLDLFTDAVVAVDGSKLKAVNSMRVRQQTVEHPFGTLKAWMGSPHFLTRTLKRVGTEMSLHMLACNMKRVIAILGDGPLMQAIQT